jgi:hypothetical protein
MKRKKKLKRRFIQPSSKQGYYAKLLRGRAQVWAQLKYERLR